MLRLSMCLTVTWTPVADWPNRLQGDQYTAAGKTDMRERRQLIQLVKLQSREIDALKGEIMLLSRKGGQVLPPVQPPVFLR